MISKADKKEYDSIYYAKNKGRINEYGRFLYEIPIKISEEVLVCH